MNYTVNKLAQLSRVSIRTLRFYDVIGLLKPAFVAQNGYRYYQEPQVLMLQQILFLKELGFELKQIRDIVAQSDFNKVETLQAHKKVIRKNITRMQGLLKTIDKTINHLQGKQSMEMQEIFIGFSPEKQKEYEEYLRTKLGEKVQSHFQESERNVLDWTQADWTKIKQEFDAIHRELSNAIQLKLEPDSTAVQKIVGKHFELIKKFWKPDKESYRGLSQHYIEHADFRKFYAHYHPDLAQFLADAIQVYASKIT